MTDWSLDWRIYPWAAFNSLLTPPSVAPDETGDNLSLCINRQYLPYLLGAIAPLTFPDFFSGDATQQALAANYFQQVWYMLISAGGCPLPFDVRQNTENPCLLEKSDDGGVTWTTWANLQLCPPILRMGQGGTIEFSPDGGTTFEPVPTGSVPAQPPPAPGQDALCIAAENAALVMQNFYNQTKQYFVDGVQPLIAVTGIISLIAIAIFIPVDFPAALTAFTELWSIMTTITAFDFSSDDVATFKCDCYSNGHLSGDNVATFNFTDVYNAVNDRWGVTDLNQWTLVTYLLNIIGSDGLNRSGTVQQVTSADCTSCACGDCSDFVAPTSGVWSTIPCTTCDVDELFFDGEGMGAACSSGEWAASANMNSYTSPGSEGWCVTINYSGSGLVAVHYASAIDPDCHAPDCWTDPHEVAAASGVTFTVPSDHPYVGVTWNCDPTFRVAAICVSPKGD